MDSLSLLRGFRYVDSFFPSGGFAYSSGLEAAVAARTVQNGNDLDRYTREYLEGALGRREAVAVGWAHGASGARDVPRLMRIDAKVHAMSLCRETREGSRQMGRQVLRVAAQEEDGLGVAREFLEEVEEGRTPGHLAPVLGMALRSCGWGRREAIAGFLYQAAVGLASAALRLLPVGQKEVQRLLGGWLPMIDGVASCATRTAHMQAWAPLHDIDAMRHHRLAVRLFRS